jgi:hypothetical protein
VDAPRVATIDTSLVVKTTITEVVAMLETNLKEFDKEKLDSVGLVFYGEFG